MQYQSDFISGVKIKENGIDLLYPLYAGYQNIIIIIIAYVFVISSRAKYRLVSNSITRRRFDSSDTTTIL